MLDRISKLIAWLQGKKTYTVAIGAILTSLGAYISGSIGLEELIRDIFAALLSMTFRAALKKQ